MSTAAATASDRAAQPVPTRAWTRASATLNAVARLVTCLFNLIRLFDLIRYGRALALTFGNHLREAGHGLAGWFLGTSDLEIIGTRMRRGVMRSATLYKARWVLANRGFSLRLPELRRDRTPPGQGDTTAHADATAQDGAPAKTAHPKWSCDLSSLPTEQDAADEARRRTAWVMIPAICTDSNMIAEVDRCKAPASRVETPRFEAPLEHQRPNCLSAVEQLCDVPPPQTSSAECSSPEAEPRAAFGNAFERTETAPAMPWPVSPHSAREVAAAALP